jgi:hypothetical protein
MKTMKTEDEWSRVKSARAAAVIPKVWHQFFLFLRPVKRPPKKSVKSVNPQKSAGFKVQSEARKIAEKEFCNECLQL